MEYYVPEQSHAKSPQIAPTWLIALFACLSSLGFLARFASFDPTRIERLLDYQTRQVQLQGAFEEVLCEANQYVHSITEHCQGRDLAPWENWAQWLMGQFYSPLMRTQNPRWIVYGGKGDCSERAAVLQDLLISQGIPSRFIGLGGHVVLEARNETGNWILDPDYGVVIKTGIEELEGQTTGELSGWLIQNGIAPPESNQYEQIVRSKHDNIRLDWNEPLSPRLKKLESFCELAVWLIPLVCWLWVGWSLRPVELS